MHGLKRVFSIDLRTLALFRVGLGFLLLLDLLTRSRHLAAHYTDYGVFSREAAIEYMSPWRLSLHLANGSADFQVLLFVIAGLCTMLLVLGWCTRIMTFLSWLFLLSLQNRNPVLLQGGDNLLLLMLFWGLFLPLGARFSVDAAMHTSKQDGRNDYFSVATMALLIQFMSVYFFSAFLKSHPEWIPQGTATLIALSTDVMAQPMGVWLRQFPLLLQGLTYFVWCLELLGPLLMFSPLLFLPSRLTLMGLFIAMHLGFLLCLKIGLFPFISILSILCFMPGEVWERIAAATKTAKRRGVRIYYDRDCGFCRKTCLLIRTFLLLRDTPVEPAQDVPEIYALMQQHNSWVVFDWDDSVHLRWGAVALVFRRSVIFHLLGRFMAWGPMSSLGERIYELVATHRDRLSGVTARLLPYRLPSLRLRLGGSLLAGAFMVMVFAHNISTLEFTDYRLPTTLRTASNFLRLDQKWNMFAPKPLRVSRWAVAEGEGQNGENINIAGLLKDLPGGPVLTPVGEHYPSERWRKYHYRILTTKYENQTEQFAEYLCRQAGRRLEDGTTLALVRLYREAMTTRLDWVSARTYFIEKIPSRTQLLEYDCLAKKPISNLDSEPSEAL